MKTIETETKPVNLPRLNRIWEGIKSGELKHNQCVYHCNTSHCIAGWEIVFLLNENNIPLQTTEGGSTSGQTLYKLVKTLDIKVNTVSDSAVARASLGLNKNETKMLFDPDARFEIQDALVEYLNRGQRLDNSEDSNNWSPENSEDTNSIYLKGGIKKWSEFTDILDEKDIKYNFNRMF